MISDERVTKDISGENDYPFLRMPETPGYKIIYHTLDLPESVGGIENGIDFDSVSIIENAVKHGVGMKKGGGTVKIATRETEDARP